MKSLLTLIAAFQLYAAQAQYHTDSTIIKSKEEITSEISKNYGLDTLNINFEVLPETCKYNVLGIYSPWTDSLKLNYYEIERSAKRLSMNKDSLVAKTMRHELGHYKVDKMCEKLGLKQAINEEYFRDILDIYTKILLLSDSEKEYANMLPKFVEMKLDDISTIIIDKMVNEGIGLYFEDKNKFPIPTTWPTSINSIRSYFEYRSITTSVGHALVHPIISRYGDKGIEYLLRNMPTKDEFSDLESYQAKAMDALGK